VVTNFFTIFYKRYSITISLNKNLLISGTTGFNLSLVVAYESAKYSTDDFANSAITVIATLFAVILRLITMRELDKNINSIYV
jgi:hypothetical protein